MEFQRLTKYPLLLENIVKHTKSWLFFVLFILVYILLVVKQLR